MTHINRTRAWTLRGKTHFLSCQGLCPAQVTPNVRIIKMKICHPIILAVVAIMCSCVSNNHSGSVDNSISYPNEDYEFQISVLAHFQKEYVKIKINEDDVYSGWASSDPSVGWSLGLRHKSTLKHIKVEILVDDQQSIINADISDGKYLYFEVLANSDIKTYQRTEPFYLD